MMNKRNSCFSRLGVKILAALFVFITPWAFFLFNFEQHLLAPQAYKQALQSQGLYQRFPTLLADQLTRPAVDGQAVDGLASVLNAAQWESLWAELLPSEYLQAQTESLIDQAFVFLESDAETLNLVISTRELRQLLVGPQGLAALRSVVLTMPPCTVDQVQAELGKLLIGGQIQIPTCRPPEAVLGPMLIGAHSLVAKTAGAIPDEMPLSVSFATSSATGVQSLEELPFIFNALKFFRSLRGWALPLLVISFLLFIAIAVLGIRSWTDLGQMWGRPLAQVGFFLLLPTAILAVMLGSPLENALGSLLPGYVSQAVVDVVIGVLRSVAQPFLLWLGVEAALVCVAGLGLMLVGLLLRPDEERSVIS